MFYSLNSLEYWGFLLEKWKFLCFWSGAKNIQKLINLITNRVMDEQFLQKTKKIESSTWIVDAWFLLGIGNIL